MHFASLKMLPSKKQHVYEIFCEVVGSIPALDFFSQIPLKGTNGFSFIILLVETLIDPQFGAYFWFRIGDSNVMELKCVEKKDSAFFFE